MKSPTKKQIKKARKKAKLTQDQAAELIGRTRRSWLYWESGERKMPVELWMFFKLKIEIEGN